MEDDQNKNNPIGCGTAPGNLVEKVKVCGTDHAIDRHLYQLGRLPGAVPQPF